MAKKALKAKKVAKAKYKPIIEKIFFDNYQPEDTVVAFTRPEIFETARALGIQLPDNKGDVLYSFRYRSSLPESVAETAPVGQEWCIFGKGQSKYQFELRNTVNIIPRADLKRIKILDATPQVISKYALSDEQAVLAIVRYNRLVDIFTGLTTYSLQNHLRTQVANVGQIEIDELYIGVSKSGAHTVIPVQAKGGKDKIGIVQLSQDLAWCRKVLPDLIPRPLAVQFMADKGIAMFELTLVGEEVKVVDERQYMLVSKSDLSDDELRVLSARETGST